MFLGLDIGGSTTKLVALEGGRLVFQEQFCSNDPLVSAHGAVGKLLSRPSFSPSAIESIYVTGAGSSFLKGPLAGLETHLVDEIPSVGKGGLFLSGQEEAVVISMGTGTAVVHADKTGAVRHIIGSAVGGGTLMALSRSLLGVRGPERFDELAMEGRLEKIDVNISDISCTEIAGLGDFVTASNLGKLEQDSRPEDIAIGIACLVFETIGTLAVMASRLTGCENYVLTGNLTKLRSCWRIMELMTRLYGCRFVPVEGAEYATAIGATLHVEDEAGHRNEKL